MIRLDKQTAIKVWIALKQVTGLGRMDFIRNARNEITRTMEQEDNFDGTLMDLINDLAIDEGDLNQIEATLLKLIKSREDPSAADGELISTLVETLTSPYARNGLQPFVSQLRDAILLPEEIRGVVKEIRKADRVCMTCGVPFQPREVATFSTDGKDAGFQCTRCNAPRMSACPTEKCTGKMVLSDSISRFFVKQTCDQCKTRKRTGESMPEVGPEVGPGVPIDVHETLRNWQVRAGTPVRDPGPMNVMPATNPAWGAANTFTLDPPVMDFGDDDEGF